MESFELQALREVVKENGPAVVKNFERKFKEIRVEGKRKSLKESTALYTERSSPTYYKLSKSIWKQFIWEQNLKQEKDSIIPDPDPKTGISPKMKEQGPSPSQDIIPITGMILAPEQELIGSNLLAEDQSPLILIDRGHSPEHNPTLL